MPILLYDLYAAVHANLSSYFVGIPIYWSDQDTQIKYPGQTRITFDISLERDGDTRPDYDIPVTAVVRVFLYHPLITPSLPDNYTDAQYLEQSDLAHAIDLVDAVISWGTDAKLLDGMFTMDFAGETHGQAPTSTGQYKEFVYIVEFDGQISLSRGHKATSTGSVPASPRVLYISGGEGPPIQRISITYKVGDSEETKVVYEA